MSERHRMHPTSRHNAVSASAGRWRRLRRYFWGTTDPKQRIRFLHSLLSLITTLTGVALLQFAMGSPSYHIDPELAWHVSIYALSGSALFAFCMRSGLNLKLRSDPSLVHVQMLYGITVIAVVYPAADAGRGVALMPLGLLLVFGLFKLTAREARMMSLISTLLMGSSMYFTHQINPLRYPAEQEWIHFGLVTIVTSVMAILAGQLAYLRERQQRQKKELSVALARIEDLAAKDSLTKLYNRRYQHSKLHEQAAEVARGGRPFVVALLDLDHFKLLNDTHGHAAGDIALCHFANLLQAQFQTPAVASRWGGEEFLIFVPHMNSAQVDEQLNQLRLQLLQCAPPDLPDSWRLSFSAGIATFRGQDNIESVIARADKSLYQAKTAGRSVNRFASTFDISEKAN